MPDPWFRNGLIRDAIGKALFDEMSVDPSIHLFGEGCDMKIHYDAPQIEKTYPDRVHTMPISEDANTNFAVGAALLGVKPVVDIITADFLYRAMDSIANTAAKLNFVLPKGEKPKTILIRAEFLTAGPTTGQRPEAIFCHIPGVNVVVPSTPVDAYGLTRSALHTPGVTILFEDRMIADAGLKRSALDCGPLNQNVPLGKAAVRVQDPDAKLTIITYGLMRQVVEEALVGVDVPVEVIDLRTLYPLDWDTMTESVKRTRAFLTVEPCVAYGGVSAEIGAVLIGARPRVALRTGAPRTTLPASAALHHGWMPTRDGVRSLIQYMTR